MTTLRPDPASARERILDAFADALLAGAYDRLTVAQLLRDARVGRATFYSHFRHKEDLLAHSVQRMCDGLLPQCGRSDGALGFLLPWLQHVDSHRAVYQAFVGRESFQTLELHLRRVLRRLLQADLQGRGHAALAEDELLLQACVGAILSGVMAWVERRLQATPAELAGRLVALLASALPAVPAVSAVAASPA